MVMFLFFSSVGVSIDFTVEFFSILGRNIFRWIVLRTDAKFSLWLCFSSSVVVFDFRVEFFKNRQRILFLNGHW